VANRLPAPPGTLLQRGPNKRWYWRVKLPGDARRKEIPLRPQGHLHATTDRRLAEAEAARLWHAAVADADPAAFSGTVSSLSALYIAWARARYRRSDGAPSSQVHVVENALRALVRMHPTMPAEDMNAARLQGVRQAMIDQGFVRKTVNSYTTTIKHMFKWAGQQGVLNPLVYAGLLIVGALRAGEFGVREGRTVRPAAAQHVQAALDHAPPTLADMIRLQALTGMRPGEVVALSPAEVDREGVVVKDAEGRDVRVWIYRPLHHKTAHLGKQRAIALGPLAQTLLAPYLLREPEAACFSPAEVCEQRARAKSAARLTPLNQGNRPGTHRVEAPRHPPGDRYTTRSYGGAIHAALKAARRALAAEFAKDMGIKLAREQAAAAIALWAPNQLRHSVATEAARTSLDLASAVLGHASVNTTLIYAERDMRKAAGWAAAHG